MILIRYFILALLVYLLYYLLSSLFRNKSRQRVARQEQAEAEKVSDVLVEDPICHKLVPKGQALRAKIDGEVLYFCSEECCERYEKQSEEKV